MLRVSSYLLVCAVAIASAFALGTADAQDRMGSRLQGLDTNGDGMISRDEAQAHAGLAHRFDEIDLNHDGQLSPDELRAFHAAHPRGARGQHGGGKLFARYDTNHDGVIERSEVGTDRKALKRFDAADLNHDGVVTPDEARAAMQAHRAARAAAGSPGGLPPSGDRDGGMPYGQSTVPPPGYGAGSGPVMPGSGTYNPGVAPSGLAPNGSGFVQGGRSSI
jgi:Ca2+-binding EF-hand superfamily protein